MASTGTETKKNQENTAQSPGGTGVGTAAQPTTSTSQTAGASQSTTGGSSVASTSGREVSRGSGEQEGVSRRGWPGAMYFPSTHEFFSNPFGAMRRMQDQMDRMFAEALSGSGGGAGQGRRGWAPAVDVTERQGNLIVHAELPGIRPEDVQLEVANDTLVISGSRERSEEHEEQGIHRRERMYGSFYREIPLPEGVNADQARAKYNNGVLEITIPMPQQQSRSRRIEIGTGSEESGSGSKKT